MKASDDFSEIDFLKQLDFSSAKEYALKVGQNTSLVPVGHWILSEVGILQSLTDWRFLYREFFFQQFESSVESTRSYLSKYSLAEKNRVLFLVIQQSRVLGHLGLSNINGTYAEIDNVIKSPDWQSLAGVSSMRDCLKSLIEWARETLEVRNFGLRVLSSNTKAIKLYLDMGFAISRSQNLVEDPQSEWGSLIVGQGDSNNESLRMLSMAQTWEAASRPSDT
jgi:RimJ/RimL family protein N-acetyltransferase